jgi:hypothetical protein
MGLPPDTGDTVANDLLAECGPDLPILVITADGKAPGGRCYLHVAGVLVALALLGHEFAASHSAHVAGR